MKSFDQLNYYEMLEVPINASPFEIRQAYRDALSIYSADSLVTPSLFTKYERDEVLKNVEEAFLTLIDEKKRADYDRVLVNSGKANGDLLDTKWGKKPIPLFPTDKPGNENAVLKRVTEKVANHDVKDISDEIFSKEFISGDDLRRLREALGIELEEIFEATRVTVDTLTSIEGNVFGSLPPAVILKNFLRQYAKVLLIDSERVVDGYMKYMDRG